VWKEAANTLMARMASCDGKAPPSTDVFELP